MTIRILIHQDPANPARFDQALRRFKKFVHQSGIIKEYKARSFYQKPSEVETKRKSAVLRRIRRQTLRRRDQNTVSSR